MRKEIFTAIAISVLLIFLIATICSYPVRADSASFINFVDSGVTIFSPLNATYYYKNLILNLSLHSAGYMGGVDRQISMNYSIDNVHNDSVPLKSDGEMHVATRAVGMVALPELSEGSHQLTIYLYGLNQRTYEPKYLSFVNTVYFSTVGTFPITNISVENKTYNSTSIPLNFNVNEETSQLSYSIDYSEKVIISGNTTLANMTDGTHNLVIYANDTAGNTALSITHFTVNTQPSPSPNPSPTPTQSPSQTTTPSPSIPEFPSWIAMPLIIAATLFAVLFVRRKKASFRSNVKR